LVDHTVNIIDSKFDKHFSIEYKLSILIGMDSFFYFIEDMESNALVLKQIQYQSEGDISDGKEQVLKQILLQEKYLQLPYAEVSICYSSPKFTIVPQEVFNKHQLDAYLTQVTRISKQEAVSVCRLAVQDANIVYSIDKIVLDIAKSYFPGAKHMHVIAPLLTHAYQYTTGQRGYKVFVHTGIGIMGIFLFKWGDLQFANTFSYETENDFLYYVLLIYEEFGLDTEKIPLLWTGRIQKKSALYEKVKKYVKHLHIVHSPSYYHYGPAFQNVNFHYYHDLLSMRLCE